MSPRVPLYRIAHARAGDKGNDSLVSVWPYDRRHFAAIARGLTAERLRATYPALLRGPVEVKAFPRLGGFLIVMRDALEGGVNASLGLDSHGKSWSYLILRLDIELDDHQLSGQGL